MQSPAKVTIEMADDSATNSLTVKTAWDAIFNPPNDSSGRRAHIKQRRKKKQAGWTDAHRAKWARSYYAQHHEQSNTGKTRPPTYTPTTTM